MKPPIRQPAMQKISLLFFLTVLSCSVSAQEPVAQRDKPGTWTYAFLNDANTTMYVGKFGMTAQELAAYKDKLDHIVNALHQYPVMLNPKGVDPLVQSRPYYMNGFKDPMYYGYTGEIWFRLCPWFESKGKVYKQTIEPPSYMVLINQIQKLKTSAFNVAGPEDPEVKKAENRVNDICRPMKIRELGPGVTLFDGAIVVCKPDRSVYLPCTVGEAYKRLVAYYEAAAKKEPVFGALLEPIRKEFSAIPTEKLKGPAFFGGEVAGITAVPNKDPLYLFNNEFFDRSKPKTDIQLIVFPVDADYFRKETDFVPNDVGFLRIYQFLHALDAGQLVNLID
jgi:hypothetical protein